MKAAAQDLNHAMVDAGSQLVRNHPWALTTLGFCGGLAIPLLFRSRSEQDVETIAENAADDLRGVWGQARTIAVEALTCALVASLDHFIGRAAPEARHVCE